MSLACENVIPAVPVEPSVCLWTTLRANDNFKRIRISIIITIHNNQDHQDVQNHHQHPHIHQHHHPFCEEEKSHKNFIYAMLYFKWTIIMMISIVRHLPLNCMAFSVSKLPLPSTYDPTSSSFLYT